MDYEIAEIWEAMKKRKYDNTRQEISDIILNSDVDSEDYLEVTLAIVVEAVHAQAGSIWCMDPDGLIRAKASYQGGDLDGIELKPGTGIAGKVIDTGEPVLIENCKKDKTWHKDTDDKTGFETKTMICVPIRGQESEKACVQLINRTDGLFFDDEDVELVKSISKSIANAYDEKRKRKEITEPLFLGKLILESSDKKEIRKLLSDSRIFASKSSMDRARIIRYAAALNKLIKK